ncbi:MAG: hypothetical protein J7M13_06260 [Synergistetes bacterium]|nr:hypothetical protein [Synergistota bacterium]
MKGLKLLALAVSLSFILAPIISFASPLSSFKMPLPSFVKPGLKLYYNAARSTHTLLKNTGTTCMTRLYILDVLNPYQAVATLTLYSPNHTSPPIVETMLLGGACDFWINPAYVKNLNRPDLGIKIRPGIITIDQPDHGYSLKAVYDSSSGLIKSFTEKMREANSASQNIMIYFNYAWGKTPAWVYYPPPGWIQPGRSLTYAITFGVMGTPMPGGSMTVRIDSVQGKLIRATIIDQNNPMGRKVLYYVSGYWHNPQLLRTLQTGMILDEDRILSLREYVAYRDQTKVVITLQGGGITWAKGTYALDSGAMISGEMNLIAGGSMYLTLRGFR